MWTHQCSITGAAVTQSDAYTSCDCGAVRTLPICPHTNTKSTADEMLCVDCGAVRGFVGGWYYPNSTGSVEEKEGVSSVLETQVGGDHYKKLGRYQPLEVLKVWLTPEEFRGYMKGTAIAYLAREQDKGKDVDIEKAMHTLQGLLELTK